MIGQQSVLAIVPARGGSKAVPRKNIRMVGGKPLLAWTIEAARAAETVDTVVLSSDDLEIIAAARAWGCDVPFVRPAALSTDTASMIDVVHHAIDATGRRHDWVVLLQPTSPLRTASDIDAAVRTCAQAGAPACVTLSPAEKTPFWMYFRDDRGRLEPVINDSRTLAYRRQDLPPIYVLNGAVYVARCDWLIERSTFLSEETIGHIMPRERSIDIDTELDIVLAEALLSARSNGAL